MVQRVVPADVCSIRVTVVIILCLVGVLDEQGVRIAAVAFDALLPLALESSSYLPVSVCGTGTAEIHTAFLAIFHPGLRY